MIAGLNHITLAVAELDASLRFYTELLRFTAHAKWNGGAYLSAGDLWLCLSLDEPDTRSDYTHIAFAVIPADYSAFVRAVEVHKVVQWKENSSEGDSVYFLDPDGHKLEVHSGSLKSRLSSLRTKPYDGLVWLDEVDG